MWQGRGHVEFLPPSYSDEDPDEEVQGEAGGFPLNQQQQQQHYYQQDQASEEEEEEEPAAAAEGDEDSLFGGLRTCWQFACIVQFFRLFAGPLKLKPFSADYLEKALFSPSEFPAFLSELVHKLLRSDANAPYQDGDAASCWGQLQRKMSSQWRNHFTCNPLSKTTFNDISPLQRVGVDRQSSSC